MIEKRTEIDPQPSWFNDLVYSFDIFDDVMCGVDEETGSYTIPSVFMKT